MDESFYMALLDNLADGIYFVDPDRAITYWNKSAERISGYFQNEVVGSHCSDNILNHVDLDGNQLCTSMCPLAKTLKDGKLRHQDVFLQHKNGQRIPVSIHIAPIKKGDRIIGAVESFNDNSNKIAALQRVSQLEEENLTDPLTGIGNRRYTENTLTARLEENERYNWRFALLFIDIDHFKKVNDQYGHAAGDMVLKTITGELLKNLRSFDFIGRWGGEEFLLLLVNMEMEDKVIEIADRLRMLVENSRITYQDKHINVTISVGATISKPDDTMETLVNRTDELMYVSKRKGRNQVTFEK